MILAKNPVESFGSSIFSGGPPILIHEVRILRRVEHSDIILFATWNSLWRSMGASWVPMWLSVPDRGDPGMELIFWWNHRGHLLLHLRDCETETGESAGHQRQQWCDRQCCIDGSNKRLVVLKVESISNIWFILNQPFKIIVESCLFILFHISTIVTISTRFWHGCWTANWQVFLWGLGPRYSKMYSTHWTAWMEAQSLLFFRPGSLCS